MSHSDNIIVLITILVVVAATQFTNAVAPTSPPEATNNIDIDLTCPSTPDLTAATPSELATIDQQVKARIVKACKKVKAKDFLGSASVQDANTLQYTLTSTLDTLEVNRCLDKLINKKHKTIKTANGCTIMGADPAIQCTTSYTETVTVNVQGKNLMTKSNEALVYPMRTLGQKLADACGVRECDVDLWNVGSATVVGTRTFEMNVKDASVASTLSSCIMNNKKKIKVNKWFIVKSIDIVTTTTQAPVTTTQAPATTTQTPVTTAVQTSGWVLSADGDDCNKACQGMAPCNAALMSAVDTQAEISFVAQQVGVTCSFFPSGSTSYYPAYTVFHECYIQTGTSTCSSSNNNYSRFCCCGTNCPTS